MPGYVLKRLLSAIPTLFIVVTLAFFLMRLAPGGPFDLERPLDPIVMKNLARIYRLDQPLYVQYATYLGSLLQGDLGPSFYWRDFTVNELFGKALPISIRLGLSALVLAVLVGAALGTLAAARQNGWVDRLVMATAALGLTIPTFVIAPLLQLSLGLSLKWLPIGGWDNGDWQHASMPVLTLALPQIAVIARLIRAAMVEVLRSNPIRTLRANGLPARVIYLHALRASALPAVSYLGPAAAALMTGSIIVENIFAIPGVGRYFIEGALSRDYTLVMGTVVLISVMVVVLNLMVDLAYALIDPRVRHE